MIELKNKAVAEKYEITFGEAQKDIHVHVPGKYSGPLSGITLEAADQHVEKENGKLLKPKSAVVKNTSANSISTATKDK